MNANTGDQMEPQKTTRSDRTEWQQNMDEDETMSIWSLRAVASFKAYYVVAGSRISRGVKPGGCGGALGFRNVVAIPYP